MADRIKGITIEIGGDTTGLRKALNGVNSEIRGTQSQLKDVERLLKLDPTNTELLRQRHRLLAEAVSETKEKLDTLKEAEKQVQIQFEQGKVSQEQYEGLKREIADTERQLKDLEVQAANSNLALKKIGEVGETLQNTGKKATEAGKALTPVTAAITGAGVAAVKSADDMQSAVNTFLTATGAYKAETEEAAEATEQFEEIFKEIYKNNYGESLMDIAQSASQVKQNMQDIPVDGLQQATEAAITLRDVFGYEVTESTRAANTLMENFGVTADEAFNLIAQGAQNGLDYSGELIDNINEYSVQFEKVGMSAEDMFNIFASGAKNGAFNLDKIGDAVKELSIRVIDGSDTTKEGFKAAGLSAEKMAKEFGKGGESAKKAFKQTITALKEIEDPLERNTAGINLFGTMWEDLGETVVLSMADAEESISKTNDTMEKLQKQKYDDLKSEFASIGRAINTDVVMPLGETLIPITKETVAKIKELVDGFAGLSPEMQRLIIDIGLVAASIGPLLIVAGQIATGLGAVMTAVSTLGPALAAFGAAGGPVLLTATAFGLMIEAMSNSKDEADQYAESLGELTPEQEQNKKIVDELTESYTSLESKRQSAVSDIEDQANMENQLWEELQSIVDENGRVKEGCEERAKVITGQLSEALDTEIEMTGNQIKNYKDLCTSIDELIQKKQANALLTANEAAYAEALTKQTDAYMSYNQAKKDVEETTWQMLKAQEEEAKASEEIERLWKQNIETGEDVTEASAEWARKQEQSAAIADSLAEKISGLNQTYHEAQTAYEGYNAIIASYEGLAAAIVSNDQEAISDAVLKTTNNFLTAETGTRESLARQVAEYQTKYQEMKAAVEAGAPGITSAQVENMAKLVTLSQEELEKLPTIAGQATANTAASLSEKRTDFEQAGTDSATGFADGIAEGAQQAADAAGKMADESVDAMKTSLDSHSPSKVTKAIGSEAFDAGFAEGITEGTEQVTSAVTQVTNAATTTLNSNLNLSKGNFVTFRSETSSGWSTWAASLIETLKSTLAQINTETNDELQKMKTTVATSITDIETNWKKQLEEIRKGHEKTMTDVTAKTTETMAEMSETVDAQTAQMKEDAITAMEEMVIGIAENMDEIEPTIQNGFKPGIDYITSLIREARTWGNDMMQGLIQGLEDYLDELEDVCEDIADTISDNLHFTRPERGSLRNYEEWMPHFMQGLAKGIEDNRYLIAEQMKKLTDDMSILQNGSINTPIINFSNKSILILDGEQIAETVDTYLGDDYG